MHQYLILIPVLFTWPFNTFLASLKGCGRTVIASFDCRHKKKGRKIVDEIHDKRKSGVGVEHKIS